MAVDLRAQVVALAERALRRTLRAANSDVPPDVFLAGLHRLREERAREKAPRRIQARAAHAVHAIKMRLRDAPEILAEAERLGMPIVSHLAELRRLGDHFAALPYPGSIPLPWEIEVRDGWTRRKYVLHEFDSESFLGLQREATVSELAAISIIMDPEHGCGDRRRGDAKKAWQILKQERDAIGRDRKADVQAAAKRVQKPYEPPADPGPNVKRRPPGKYVSTVGGRLVRIGDPSR